MVGFMGLPSMNFITASLGGGAGQYRLRIVTEGEEALVLPWPVSRETPARVSVAEPTGADILLRLPLGDGEVTARVGPKCTVMPGARLNLRVDMGRAVLFDSQSEQRLA
ncbi:TOBE domain protein [Halomonas chromatireducens]|uniref:TOBE domain protein n=1 Tax=Halomonas chromatireducens TaxID=507626 RepID=A0A120JWD7_9GAMM|nr:TOBE domain protein [Halomonas chromatireducens]